MWKFIFNYFVPFKILIRMLISLKLPYSKVVLFVMKKLRKYMNGDTKTNLLSLHFLNSRVECAMIKDYH